MKFLYLFLFIFLFSSVSAGLNIGYDLESSVSNVVLNVPETPINYSTIPTVNSSNYWDDLDTPADITYDDLSAGDVNALGYTGFFNFIEGSVGKLSMDFDPWLLEGTDLQIEENLIIDKNITAPWGIFNNITVGNIFSYSSINDITFWDDIHLNAFNIFMNDGMIYSGARDNFAGLIGGDGTYEGGKVMALGDTRAGGTAGDVVIAIGSYTSNPAPNSDFIVRFEENSGTTNLLNINETTAYFSDTNILSLGNVTADWGFFNNLDSTDIETTNLNVTGTLTAGDLVWDGNLDMGRNNITNADNANFTTLTVGNANIEDTYWNFTKLLNGTLVQNSTLNTRLGDYIKNNTDGYVIKASEVNVTGYGYFSWLGNLANKITTIFAVTIHADVLNSTGTIYSNQTCYTQDCSARIYHNGTGIIITS